MGSTTDPGTNVTARQKQGAFARWRDALQAEWKVFAASTPGKRFQERHHRKRDAERPAWKKLVSPVLRLVIVVSALILLPAPRARHTHRTDRLCVSGGALPLGCQITGSVRASSAEAADFVFWLVETCAAYAALDSGYFGSPTGFGFGCRVVCAVVPTRSAT